MILPAAFNSLVRDLSVIQHEKGVGEFESLAEIRYEELKRTVLGRIERDVQDTIGHMDVD